MQGMVGTLEREFLASELLEHEPPEKSCCPLPEELVEPHIGSKMVRKQDREHQRRL